MWMKITPMDVLMFRTPKPFSPGVSVRASSLFPPTPLTFGGAIKNMLEQNGLTPAFGKFSIKGPFLMKVLINGKTIMCFPTPSNLFKEPGSGSFIPALPPENNIAVKLNAVLPEPQMYLLSKDSQLGEPASGFISESTLSRFLQGFSQGEKSIPHEDPLHLFQSEIRTGIGLSDERRTAEDEEGMFYMAEFKRVKEGVSFLVEVDVDGVKIKEKGILFLGGERRLALYEVVNDRKMPAPPTGAGKNLFLYLATPAVFKNGWLPDIFEKTGNGYRAQVKDISFRLISASVGKPIPVGSYEPGVGPRPLYYAVPAGSVYFVELEKESQSKQFVEMFHDKKLLQENSGLESQLKLANVGFGHTFVGVWNYAERM